MGAAFQIQDDILNLTGDRKKLRQGDRGRHLGGEADLI
jgi:geranylgeranyl pyrophosphate synthase